MLLDYVIYSEWILVRRVLVRLSICLHGQIILFGCSTFVYFDMTASADEEAVTVHLVTWAKPEAVKVDKGKVKVTSLDEGGGKVQRMKSVRFAVEEL